MSVSSTGLTHTQPQGIRTRSRDACQELDDNELFSIKRPEDSGIWSPNKVSLVRRGGGTARHVESKAAGKVLLTEYVVFQGRGTYEENENN